MNETVKNLLEKVRSTAIVAGEAAGRAVDTAGKKAGELWEITRLNVQLHDLNDEMNDYFKKIGELVYRSHQNPEYDTECVDGWLEKMDGIQQAAAEIKEKIIQLKQVNICAGCGKQIDKEDAFCRYCGEETPKVDDPAESQEPADFDGENGQYHEDC